MIVGMGHLLVLVMGEHPQCHQSSTAETDATLVDNHVIVAQSSITHMTAAEAAGQHQQETVADATLYKKLTVEMAAGRQMAGTAVAVMQLLPEEYFVLHMNTYVQVVRVQQETYALENL